MEVALRNGGFPVEIDVSLARKGDKAAFERLIQAHKMSLYRVAKGILRSEDDIGDAMQETILKAYKGLPKLRKDNYFKTWLIKILINECNCILRYRKKAIPVETIPTHDLQRVAHQTDSDRIELMSLIDSLAPHLKVATILYYYEDLPLKTIALLTDVPEGTVKSRLSRARENLYQTLVSAEGDAV